MQFFFNRWPGALAVLAVFWPLAFASASEPTFTNDVMAVLSKAGCNAGACHGNQNGKGGFKLSLRGQDPAQDHAWLTREFGGRRVDLLDPENSMILLKPSGRLAHQGGVRFRRGSAQYNLLRDWIAAGAPPPNESTPRLVQLDVSPTRQVIAEPQDRVRLKVTAHFSDGKARDVTEMAVYETSNMIAEAEADGLVRRAKPGETTVMVRFLDQQAPVRLAFIPQREDFSWSDPPAKNYIDSHVFAKLQLLRINPSPLCDDHVFVRRAFLDALGLPPTADEARAFVADPAADKRARLIDRLLSRSEFSEHWALKWSDLLRNEEKVLDSRGVEVFHGWLRDWFAAGKPLDEFVRALLTGRGSTYEQAPANYYRANRDAVTRAETTARLFLGTRLGCAKCHNHPFDRWTQDDYYSWAALFARVDYKIVKNERRDKLDKNEFNGEQIVLVNREGEVKNVRTGEIARPRFLGAETPDFGAKDDRLPPLAEWLTSADNRRFAKSQVNLIWYHMLGRGLVEPIDDFRLTNPAVNPPLLEALADDLVVHDFDLRHMVRTIMNSRTYQLSAVPNETNQYDEVNFSRALVVRLPAEKLLDAQTALLDAPPRFAGYDEGIRAGQIPGVRKTRRRDSSTATGDRFLKMFGKPERLLGCECERSNETTLSQAFLLVGGEGLHERIAQRGNRMEQWSASTMSSEQIVDDLFWTALSRPPSEEELAKIAGFIDDQQDRLAALQDVAWALMNSKEFLFRR